MTPLEFLASFSKDPPGFVRASFPWGVPGTELEDERGPFEWQWDVLNRIKDGLVTLDEAIRIAVTSGHGIGKSALVSWLILWAMTTCEDTRGVVTANTETQLKTKTWAELAKWFNLFRCKELFEFAATRITVNTTDTEKQSKWRIDMVPWSERNTEAFAGLHNKGKRVLLLMDEASAIPDMIWETAEGALTDRNTEIIWCAFGNPTRNKGRFRECFPGGKFAQRWSSRAVDSRTVPNTQKELFRTWAEDYGEDSDFFRVRVRGAFPRIDSESFIPFVLAMEAVQRTLITPMGDPVVLGVDVGRFGDDPSVIYPRRGRDAVTLPIEVLFGADTMQTAARVAAMFTNLHCTIAYVDEGGVGGGVVDRLRQLAIPVVGVDFGSSADNYDVNAYAKYANKRAEIWGALKDWLRTGTIPNRVGHLEETLPEELSGPTYGMNNAEAIQLESKKDMRKRGLKSPNVADALACTFAYPVWRPPVGFDLKPFVTPDYNPYEGALT